MIDVKKQLAKDEARLEAMNGKTLQHEDWIKELYQQVYGLNQIIQQQQEEIDLLKIKNVLW